jgi:hypothetical protein
MQRRAGYEPDFGKSYFAVKSAANYSRIVQQVMSTEKIEEQLILQIRELAGQLGELHHREQEGPSDAEHYDFQVMVGLANATVDITDFDPDKLFYWLGYCIIGLGLDMDPRICALKDALENEVNEQLDKLIESEEGEL